MMMCIHDRAIDAMLQAVLLDVELVGRGRVVLTAEIVFRAGQAVSLQT